MAYDAGSVVFTFEADTEQVDKALDRLNKAKNAVAESASKNTGKGNPYLTDEIRKWSQLNSAARQYNKMLEQKNKMLGQYYGKNLTDMAAFLRQEKQNEQSKKIAMQQNKQIEQSLLNQYRIAKNIVAEEKLKSELTKRGLQHNQDGLVEYQRQLNQENENKNNTDNTQNFNFSLISKYGKYGAIIAAATKLTQKSISATKKEIQTINKILSTTVSLSAKVVGETSKFVYTFSGMKAEMNIIKSIFAELGSEIKNAFSLSNIEEFAKKCIELGSNLTEVQNVVDTVFKGDAEIINDWSKTVTKQFGMSELSAKSYASTMGAMLTSAGLSGEAVKKMSVNLSELTADMASLYNLEYDDMFEKIRSGMSGMVRPLAQLGVSLHAVTLQEYLNSKGIEAKYTQLTYAQKELVRYNYLIEHTRQAQGDFAKTFYTWANQVRYLKEQIKAMMTNIGQIIIAFLNPIIIYINKIVEVVGALFSQLREKVIGILGDSAFSDALKGNDVSAMFDEATDSIDAMNASLKRATSSFDELHKLNGNDTTEEGLIDLGNLLDPNAYKSLLKDATKQYTIEIEDLKTSLIEAWQKGDFSNFGVLIGEKINEGLKWLIDKFPKMIEIAKKAASSLATFLNGMFDKIHWKDVGTALVNNLKTLHAFLLEFFNKLDWNDIGSAFAWVIKGIFAIDETTGKDILETTADTIIAGINGVSTSIRGFINTMSSVDKKTGLNEFQTIGQNFGNAINKIFSKDGIEFAQMGDNIRDLFIGIFNMINNALLKIKWDEIGKKLGRLLKEAISPNQDGVTIFGSLSNVFVNAINGIITSISEILNTPGLVDDIKEGFSTFFENIKKNVKWEELMTDVVTIKDIIKDFYKKAFESVDWGEIVPVLIDGISDAIKNGIPILLAALGILTASILVGIGKFLDDIKDDVFIKFPQFVGEKFNEFLLGIGEWFGNVVQKIIDFLFIKIPAKVGEFFTWLGEIGSKISSKIAEFFKSLGSNISEAVSSIVDKIKNAWTDVKDWFSDVGAFFKGIVNSIINIFNGFINKINGFSFKIPEALGGGTIGFNIPNIPMLAQGGYVGANMPQLAVIGDNKREGEIVSPESKIQENVLIALNSFAGTFASMLADAMQGNNGGNITIPIYLDGELISSKMLNSYELQKIRGGAY